MVPYKAAQKNRKCLGGHVFVSMPGCRQVMIADVHHSIDSLNLGNFADHPTDAKSQSNILESLLNPFFLATICEIAIHKAPLYFSFSFGNPSISASLPHLSLVFIL